VAGQQVGAGLRRGARMKCVDEGLLRGLLGTDVRRQPDQAADAPGAEVRGGALVLQHDDRLVARPVRHQPVAIADEVDGEGAAGEQRIDRRHVVGLVGRQLAVGQHDMA
ncbi:hypothetical protein RZS08_39640, partial [Arthrospira platensis SPKY1]|nr:hypothetical protein [Arthrospira platensis SPKY1]